MTRASRLAVTREDALPQQGLLLLFGGPLHHRLDPLTQIIPLDRIIFYEAFFILL